ncbi:DUF4123 domain-containing protein [Pseudomonas purpurea]|uniref:DUF4123 domain-containing protein n=1 Tax=Pseudomonas purpurea TaxID=3136737 RepID=UPI003262E8C3
MSERISPRDWLERQPLQPSQQLLAIFSNTSDAEPLQAWRCASGTQAPSPIWAGTAYAEWEPVMPYVGIVEAGSDFLEWVGRCDRQDWGWLAVSSSSLERMVEHLRSLTQVLLPEGAAVFFRFWDGRHVLPILRLAQVERAELLPVVERCLINGQALEVGGRGVEPVQVFPWWNVPTALLETLAPQAADTRIANLLKWLGEARPDVDQAYSPAVLHCKVKAFVARCGPAGATPEALVHCLMSQRR